MPDTNANENFRSMLENVLKGGLTPGGKKQAKHQSSTGTNLSDFRLEYAKSGGSTCGVCEEKIKKVSTNHIYYNVAGSYEINSSEI